jgi:RimJ/RimL family protein N-acetyltransferase
VLNGISLPAGLALRPARADDRPFLERLFRSTREQFYAIAAPGEAIDALIAQQYRLQQAAYARQWPDARTWIIQRPDGAIGQITLNENETALHIVDFVIEPGMRDLGYGTAVLNAVLTRAADRRVPVELSVDRKNPAAARLYRRLGFRVTGTSDTHQAMIRTPPRPGDRESGHGFAGINI